MNYLKTTCKIVKVNFKDILIYIAVIFGGGVFGEILDLIISKTSGESISGIGMVMSGMAFVILVFFGSVFGGYADFALAVYNGRARSTYLVGQYIMLVLEYTVSAGVFAVFNIIDANKGGADVDFIGSIPNPAPKVLAVIFGVPLIVMLFSALYAKFEKKFFWVVWVLWMALFVGGPRVLTAMEENPGSAAAKVGFTIQKALSFGSTESIIALVVIIIAIIVADILIYRNIDVRE